MDDGFFRKISFERGPQAQIHRAVMGGITGGAYDAQSREAGEQAGPP